MGCRDPDRSVDTLASAQALLRLLHDARGLPLAEIAEQIEVSPQLISNWRAGRTVPSTGDLARLRALARRTAP